MYHVRILDRLASRIDAEFYSPSALKAEAVVLASPIHRTMGQLISSGYRVVYHGIDSVHSLPPSDRLTFVSPSDVDDQGTIDFTNCSEVPRYYSTRYPKGVGYPGELLIEVKGNVSKVTVVPATAPAGLMISGSFYKALIEKGADTRYVLAFLKTSHGTVLKRRLASNSIIDYIAKDDLYSIPLPYPDRKAQVYIGDKVRQAEVLRAYAHKLIRRVDSIHDSQIPNQDMISFSRKIQRISSRRLSERLDAEHFPPAVQFYFDSLATSAQTLRDLTSEIFNGQTGVESEHGSGIGQATVANLSSTFLRGELRSVVLVNGSDRRLLEHDLLLCNAAHTKSYIGKEVTYCDGVGVIVPSTEVCVIRVDRELAPASYIRRYILTRIGYLQVQATVRGITAHSYPKDIAEISVPVARLAGQERDLWFATDDWMLSAARANRLADLLVKTAVLLVEGLIEKCITESELVEAQACLETGSSEFDRIILSRLTQRGLDVQGAAKLFPDLDLLDAVLSETTAAAEIREDK